MACTLSWRGGMFHWKIHVYYLMYCLISMPYFSLHSSMFKENVMSLSSRLFEVIPKASPIYLILDASMQRTDRF